MVRADGSVTAGNASGVNDGACALLLASETALSANDLQPLARWSAWRRRALRRGSGFGPAPAVRKVLAQTGLTWPDGCELNEAFAAQALAVTRVACRTMPPT